MSCSKSNNSSKPAIKEPDVFVTGYGSYGTVIMGSLYWENGTMVPLPGGQFATGIAFINRDIYVAGNENYNMPGGGSTTDAVYWKNGVMAELGSAPSYASGIVTSGSDIYIAGNATVNNINCAVYWKNGTLNTLVNIPYSVANAIAVSGNDVYVTGNAGSNGYLAVYWKNGVQIPMENIVACKADAIALSGSDVYVAGYVVTGSQTSAAVYWKNGQRVNFNPSSVDPILPTHMLQPSLCRVQMFM